MSCVELDWNGASVLELLLTGAPAEAMCFHCKLTNISHKCLFTWNSQHFNRFVVFFFLFLNKSNFLMWLLVLDSCWCINPAVERSQCGDTAWPHLSEIFKAHIDLKNKKEKNSITIKSSKSVGWPQLANSWKHQRGNILLFVYFYSCSLALLHLCA